MRSNDLHPERWLIGFHYSHTMHQPHRFDWPSLFHLLENQFKLVLSHSLKGFILDAGNRFAPFSPSHHPKEINYRTHPLRNLALAQQRRLVDGLGRNGHSSCHRASPHISHSLKRAAGRAIVAQVSNLLYRRFPIGRPFARPSDRQKASGLETRDTAGWKPAL